MWLIWLWVFAAGEVHVYLWIPRIPVRENGSLKNQNFEVAKFTILTLSSLLIRCRPSFPIVGLKISSLSNFTLKFPNRIFVWYLGKWSKTCPKTHKIVLLNHHFSPHSVHSHSEQWYYTIGLSVYIWHPITNKFYCVNKKVQLDVTVCTVTSSWTFLLTLNHDARNHELKKNSTKTLVLKSN